MTDRFTIEPFEFFVLPARTRFPFRYGIASMTDVPHLFVRTRVKAGPRASVGLTAEGLPPKWFTKDPGTTFEQDLPAMLAAIRQAARAAEEIGAKPAAFFGLWRELYREQEKWAAKQQVPSLLAGLGVSLVERAVLDGLCRATGAPLHQMIAANRLGVQLQEIYAELADTEPSDLLPPSPRGNCCVRHTIGLGDPLTPDDVRPEERADDGLPQDLETSIRTYGLRYFKVKLRGAPGDDSVRLREILRVLNLSTAGDFWLTVDGNENFHDFAAFRDFWEQVSGDSTLAELPKRTLVVEQPVHRDRALDEDARGAITGWAGRPPFIIDESDGAVGDVPRALSAGYAGSSYKSCKGIVKGIANACLLTARQARGDRCVLTGEDLCTLGPVALQQDLAMMAVLGIEHVERNGHHYYRGLSMLPREWQRAALEMHRDLYDDHALGFVRLRIADGTLDLASTNAAPFGVGPLLDVSGLTRLENSFMPLP
jgi:L-alanine-DL-glutamate epimerase-like enolase superfamily enzyme